MKRVRKISFSKQQTLSTFIFHLSPFICIPALQWCQYKLFVCVFVQENDVVEKTPHHVTEIIFQTICQKCADHKEIPFFHVRTRFLLVIEILTLFAHFILSLSYFLTLFSCPPLSNVSHIIHRKDEDSRCTKSTNQHSCWHASTHMSAGMDS